MYLFTGVWSQNSLSFLMAATIWDFPIHPMVICACNLAMFWSRIVFQTFSLIKFSLLVSRLFLSICSGFPGLVVPQCRLKRGLDVILIIYLSIQICRQNRRPLWIAHSSDFVVETQVFFHASSSRFLKEVPSISSLVCCRKHFVVAVETLNLFLLASISKITAELSL